MIPDNVEKIIMTKEDYDRNVEQLLYDKINAEQENERLRLELSGYRQAILQDKEMLGLKQENERLHSIIKEAKEYIQDYFYIDKETGEYYFTHTFDKCNVGELLEILGSDKE